METPSSSLFWGTAGTSSYEALEGDREADVVVVGAGITGLTAAVLLKRAGKRVVVLEMQRTASGESGHTTAHLTVHVDARYHFLERKFGHAAARLVAESVRAAIHRIESFIDEGSIACAFSRAPGFYFTEKDGDLAELEEELGALLRVGVHASWSDVFPLPFAVKGALRLENQASLHPRLYLLALAQSIPGDGSALYEQTRVIDVEDGEPCRVITSHGTVRARDVFLATNVPVGSRVALHKRLAAYRTYVVAYRAPESVPQGLYEDTASPYHYIRTQETSKGRFLIVGGEDHKTGRGADALEHFTRLEEYTRARFDVERELRYRWSGQVIESADGLPFIGKNPGSEHVYVATGFSGSGMAFGTLAGMLVADELEGRENPFGELYRATRVKPLAQAKRYLAQNADFPAHLLRDRLSRGQVRGAPEIPRGEGRLLRKAGKMLAVYRDGVGELHVRSAACPHLGCHVRWNNAERSWDCPCHGSRFDGLGHVLNGPATRDLKEEGFE